MVPPPKQAPPLLPALAGEVGERWTNPASYRGTAETGSYELCPCVPVCPPSRAEGHRQVAMGLPEQKASHPGMMGYQGVPGNSHSILLGALNPITNQSSEHISEVCRALCYVAVG